MSSRTTPSPSTANRLTLPDGFAVFDCSTVADEPLSVPFTIKRGVAPAVLARPVVYGLLFAVLTIFVTHRRLRRRGVKLRRKLDLDLKSWKFGESWAANIATVGAILGTVLSASGQLTELLPQFPSASFVGVSLLLGFLALMAPITFQPFTYEGSPTAVAEEG